MAFWTDLRAVGIQRRYSYLVTFHVRRLVRALFFTETGLLTFVPLLGVLIFGQQELTGVDFRDQSGQMESFSGGLHEATFELLDGSQAETGVSPARYETLMTSDSLTLLTSQFDSIGLDLPLKTVKTFHVEGLWSQFMRFLNRRILFVQFLAKYQAPVSAALLHLRKMKQNMDLRTGIALYEAAAHVNASLQMAVLMIVYSPLMWLFFKLAREAYFFKLNSAYKKVTGHPLPASLAKTLRNAALNEVPEANYRIFLWGLLLCINDVISQTRGWVFYLATRLSIYFIGYCSLFNRGLFLGKTETMLQVPPHANYTMLGRTLEKLRAQPASLRNFVFDIPILEVTSPILMVLFLL